jgi:leader peptidase (prepilin peptidase) / N-methyltransferase
VTGPAVVAACALLCAAAGLLVPAAIERLPEPGDEAPGPGDEGDRSEDRSASGPPAKQRYADVAARPGLAARCALVAAAAGGLVGWAVGWQPVLLGLLPLVPVAVGLAVVDWRTHLLPSVVVLPATGVLLALAVLGAVVTGERDDLLRGVLGLVLARSFYWVLWSIRSAGMGFGDVRLAALLGLALGYLGWAELVVGVYAGFLVFGVPGLAVALLRRDRSLLRRPLPFGPAMMVGALVGVVVGPQLLAGLAVG